MTIGPCAPSSPAPSDSSREERPSSPLARRLTEPVKRKLTERFQDGTLFSNPSSVIQEVLQEETVLIEDPATFTDDGSTDPSSVNSGYDDASQSDQSGYQQPDDQQPDDSSSCDSSYGSDESY